MDPLKQPAAPPPPGVTPDFANPPNSNTEIYTVAIALCSLATVILGLRIYTRVALLRAVGWDDWLCIAGQILSWVFGLLAILNTKNGFGVHIWNLTLGELIAFKKYDLAEADIYSMGTWFVKTSILVFYLRLSPEPRFRQITYGIIVFVAAYSIVSILCFTCVCRPIQAQWDLTIKDAHCFDEFSFVYANAAFNIVSDIATLVLPIRLCWRLQTTVKQKIMVLAMLCAGSFACVVAVIRVVTMTPFVHSNDVTYFKKPIAVWCLVEINVGIICGCLPTMRPLITRTFPRAFPTYETQQDSMGNNSYAMKASRSSAVQRAFNKVQKNPVWNNMDCQKPTTRDDSDSESARAIVRDSAVNGNEIVKSMEYEVTYELPPRRPAPQRAVSPHGTCSSSCNEISSMYAPVRTGI